MTGNLCRCAAWADTVPEIRELAQLVLAPGYESQR
jgi:aerobic-type carbon monoxide dehydrogenase small subunit (CoxS/CutS family)